MSAADQFGPRVSPGIRFPWFALQVRGRYEVAAANYLRDMGHEHFLPVYTTRRKWSDRLKEAKTPLFPGYLFCRFDPERRLPILKAPGVIDIVGTRRQLIPVEESEIVAIQRLVASGVPNEPWPFLQVGQKVEIECGPLCGLEGVLVEFKGNRRLILSVTLLRRSVAVEVDSAIVRPQGTSIFSSKPGLRTQTQRLEASVAC